MAVMGQKVEKCPKNMSKTFGGPFDIVHLPSMHCSGRKTRYSKVEGSIMVYAIQHYSTSLWFLDGFYAPESRKVQGRSFKMSWRFYDNGRDAECGTCRAARELFYIHPDVKKLDDFKYLMMQVLRFFMIFFHYKKLHIILSIVHMLTSQISL